MNSLKQILKKIGIGEIYWGLRNSFSLLSSYRYAIWLSLSEVFSALSYKWKEDSDKEYLAIKIRKRTHQIEKIIMLPHLYKERKEKSGYLARELDSLITGWKSSFGSEGFLEKATRVSREYKELFMKNKQCIMVGKAKDRRQTGLKEIIKSRRSVRIFLPDALSSEEIEKLVEAAKWAPSSCNCQSLKFIFVKKPELKEMISNSMTLGGIFTHLAPLILIVLADKRAYRFPDDRYVPYQDAAAAIQNVLLEAESLGLGACWVAYTSYSNIKNELMIRHSLGIPKQMLICGAVAIGKPNQEPCVQPRLDSKQLYSIDYYKTEE